MGDAAADNIAGTVSLGRGIKRAFSSAVDAGASVDLLRQQMHQAVADKDYILAGELQREIVQLEKLQNDMKDAVEVVTISKQASCKCR